MKIELEFSDELYDDLQGIMAMDAVAELRQLLHDEVDAKFDAYVEERYRLRKADRA